MSADRFAAAMKACPIVAIVRGIQPVEAVPIGDAIVAAGIRIVEVPLNSPDAFASIAAMVDALPDDIVIGAGTVLSPAEVRELQAVGGQLVVSPNVDPAVIREAARRDMACLPGFSTPTEAFAALAAGASDLKLFPAEAYSPTYLKALRAVLPTDVPVLPVGGINPDNIVQWVAAGADGFGTGSGLYRPGMGVSDVAEGAARYVAAVRASELVS